MSPFTWSMSPQGPILIIPPTTCMMCNRWSVGMLIVIPFRKSQLLFQEVVGVSLYEVVNIIDHPIHTAGILQCNPIQSAISWNLIGQDFATELDYIVKCPQWHLFECLVCHQFGDIEVFCSLCITLQSGTLMHVEQGGDLRAWHVSQDL